MPRIDDYRQAKELGKRELSGKDADQIARSSGAVIHPNAKGGRSLHLIFLNRTVQISWPDLEFSYEDSKDDVPIQQQVLLLHYLVGALASRGESVTGEWISFQDVPDGRFYMDAFQRRARDPLLKTFGQNPQQMTELAFIVYGASSSDHGDYSAVVKALPLVPVALLLWEGDDEFPPEGNILFDKNIGRILSAEDIAWLAGMVVYPLVGMVNQ
jgi:hypothetical protein